MGKPEKPWKRAYVAFSGEMFLDYNPGESLYAIQQRVRRNAWNALTIHVDEIQNIRDSDMQPEIDPKDLPIDPSKLGGKKKGGEG